MSKGLTRTLMTVAIALVSVQAMAMAPMISDIPSPVVGGINSSTDLHKFVYPDAIDLNSMASDDYTAQSKLMWSYAGTDLNYRINGVNPIDLASVDPTSPTTSQIINFTVANGESNPDGKANTVTIRNIHLAPLGGSVTFPSSTGVVAAETQPVTFFCSDGNSYSSSTVYFYTDNGNLDRLSQQASGFTKARPDDPIPSGTWKLLSGTMGSVTRKAWNNGSTGVCLEVPAAGDNMGAVSTDYNYLTLAANQVYRFRATMNSTQSTVGTVPFWDLILDNYDGTNGLNLYGFDAFNLDNEGGANAILASGSGKVYDLYWTPAAASTSQWNNATSGLFTSQYQNSRDARLRFRVMDVDSVAATQSGKKLGQICMQSLSVEAAPISSFKAKANGVVFDSSSAGLTAANTKFSQIFGATAAFSGGAVTIKPATSGSGAGAEGIELVQLMPLSGSAEAYPFHWDANELYMLEVGMKAPDTNSVTNPWDVMWIGIDSPTNEVNCESFLTGAASGLGMPKATESTYVFFYNSQKETASGTAAYHNLRWRVRFANVNTLRWGNNTGGVTVTKVKVTKVTQ